MFDSFQAVDTAPPSCSLDPEPDCSGYTDAAICIQKNWTTTATLQDTASGRLQLSCKKKKINK